MRLNREKKEFIKQNAAVMSAVELAKKTGMTEKTVHNYIKSHRKKLHRPKQTWFAPAASMVQRFSIEALRDLLVRRWFFILFFLVATFAVYARALSAGFVSDDIAVIRDNPQFTSWAFVTQQDLMSLPRTLIYFLIGNIFGTGPTVFHLVNIMFHLGVVVLLYLIFGLAVSVPVGFFTALLVAVHPLLSEPVTWISGGTYPQHSFFLLFSLLLFFVYLQSRKPGYYIFSILLAALAVWSADKAVTLPVLFTLFLYGFGDLKKFWKWLIPYYLVTSIWLIHYLLKIPTRVSGMLQERYNDVVSINPLHQLPVAISSYLELMVWPDMLSIYHSDFVLTTATQILRALVVLTLLSLLVYGFMRNRRIFFGIAFYLVALSPTLTPIGISSIIAERYAYLASVGIFLLIAYGIAEMASWRRYEGIVYFCVMAVILAYAVRTVVRLGAWQNEDTLWIATGRTAVLDPVTHMNLGDMHRRHKNYAEAEREFNNALTLNPDNAYAWYNLGLVYTEAGAAQPAVEAYSRALAIDPRLWQADQNIAVVLFESGQTDEAIAAMMKAINKNPGKSELYVNLAVMYGKAGKRAEAIEYFKKALALDPENLRIKQELVNLELGN